MGFINTKKIVRFLSNVSSIIAFLAISYFGFASTALADYSASATFTTSGTFVVPLGVTSIKVDVIVGGGGGGAGGAFTYGGGGGGAGSAISNAVMAVAPGQNVPYIVGTGGNGGTSGSYTVSGGNGGNGGSSYFGSLIFAYGGNGGRGAVVGGGGGQGGTAGGVGGTNGTNGDSCNTCQRSHGGNGGTNPFGTGGTGGTGNSTSYTTPTAGTVGNGGGAGSGWALYASGSDAGARGGDGYIRISYTADLTKPVITILGSNPVTIAANSVYVDAGATAVDNTSGPRPVTVIFNNVNTSATGTYSVVYSATDLAGNVATSSRTVIVTDQSAPVITAPATQTFEATGPTTTPALVLATAIDNIDPNPVITYSPSSFALGTTTVTWTATDSSGNFSTTTSLVVIKDTTAPAIVLNGLNPLSIMASSTQVYADAGATAFDLVDGTTSVTTIFNNVNLSATGTYSVVYSSTDSLGNTGTSSRTVIVTPQPPAVLTSIVISPLTPTVAVGTTTQFIATTLDQYGNPFPASVIWVSSNNTVGTIDSSTGLFNDLANGTTTVTAFSGSVSTSTVVTVTPAVVLDTTAPTQPAITSASATGTIITTADVSWTDSTDAQSGLQGYLYLYDANSGTVVSTTTPGIATTSATTTSSSVFGTVWFHVAAIDNAGNISSTTSYGPFVISDSAVLYKNSTVGGTFYTLFSPSLAQSIVASTTGSTTLTNSTLSTFWNINDSVMTNSSADDVNLNTSNVSNSTLINSDITNCTIINSLVKNYFATNCYIAFSTIDPTTTYSFINSTSTNSQIYASNISDSIISNNSYVATSTVASSTISNSTVTNSNLSSSTVATSTLSNVVDSGSTITNTVLSNATTTNAVIVNGVISTGTITIGGNTYVITTPTTISSLVSPTVNLLSAGNFVILSESGITDVPTSAITGNVGTTPITGASITGLTCAEVTGTIYDNDAAYTGNPSGTSCLITDASLLNTARLDMESAYTTAAGLPAGTGAFFNIGAGTVSTQTLVPGVYTWGTNVNITGDITLSGTATDVWVFQISGTLDIQAGRRIILTGGALPQNVYWQVAGAVTLLPGSHVEGNILGQTNIAMQTGATLNGRALAQTAVTLDQNIINGSGTSTPDTIAPVITINGSNPLTIVATTSGSYIDAGATAFDAFDNATTTASTTFNNVNITIPGSYSVDYSAQDIAGNIATATRAVTVTAVPDTIPPVITMNGSNPATTTVGQVYTDAGATAFDAVSGTTTVNVVNNVNTSATGTYTVDYSSTDGAGNTATTSRIVNVIAVPDTTAPVITITGANPLTFVATTTPYVDAGATYMDNIDGGPFSATTTSNNVNSSVVGTYSVDYSATDVAGNTATTSRIVNVLSTPDVTAPVITILGSNPVNVILNSTYTDAGATANDNVDGNVTANIITTNNVNTAATGTYTVDYSVVDSSGNGATSTRTVNVIATPVDVVLPVISITGGTPITITVGSTYTDQGATYTDNIDGGPFAASVLTNNVNTAATGSYQIVYSATDSSGNNSTSSRDVNVISAPADTIPPVIFITGGTPLTFQATTTVTYTDAGATYTDNIDGGPFAATTTSNNVDLTTVGSYQVVYSANDIAGNISTATRDVNVVVATTSDNIPPVITVIGGTPVTVFVNSTYTDQGATALDNVDGDVTASIASSTNVNTSIIGNYSVDYSVTDSSGNVASTSRTVNVIAAPADTIPPVITINGGSPITVLASSTYTDLGATAFDNLDGTTSANMLSSNVDTNIIGTYSVVYTATDLAGNIATATRTVNVIAQDLTAPLITILGANPMTIIKTLPYTELGATSIDNFDGNITAGIVTTGSVNTGIVGVYTIIYTSNDSSGNVSSSTRTVNVINDNVAPVITILGSNPINLTVGAVYVDAGATANDNIDGNLTGSIVSTSTVNTAVAGSYFVTYSVIDSSGNGATSTRTVNVNAPDTVPPVITILGSNPASITVGGAYIDAGATALDAVSGVTAVSTISNNVNTAVVGSYKVVYSSTDLAGNTATSTRTVNVTPIVSGGGGGGGGGGSYSPTYKLGDINHDGKIDKYDFALLMAAWGTIGQNITADLNLDAIVDKLDFVALMFNWGK